MAQLGSNKLILGGLFDNCKVWIKRYGPSAYGCIPNGTQYGMPADQGVYLRFAECSITDTAANQASWPVATLFFEWGGNNGMWYGCANPYVDGWIKLK